LEAEDTDRERELFAVILYDVEAGPPEVGPGTRAVIMLPRNGRELLDRQD
ncbi:MAG: hypothetical protein JNK52_05780, partial [Zoogloeaceae bacterium]|nr:hypothetical protein [Zoogloeaceae bacterium]